MKVILGDQIYSVYWKYLSSKRIRCTIEGANRFILGDGDSMCIGKDQFNKNTGRKISMRKALKAVFPYSDHIRRKFWESYLEMRHGKW